VLFVFAVASACRAQDSWPQFRGPDGQGHATADLPITFSDTENVVWKTPIAGRGWSSPVIDGPRIWLTTALDDGHSLHAVCLDRNSGKIVHDVELFQIAEPQKINEKNSYASPSPVIEGNRVWFHFGTYGTACLDATTSKVLWKHQDLKLDHQEGPGSTPVLCGDLLLIHCDGIDVQFLAALDKSTGKIVWKSERSAPKHPSPDQRKAFCTPLLIEVAGRKQIISVAAQRVYAYDPDGGAEIWHVELPGFSNVPRPLYADGLLVVCTGYMKPQLWAIRPDGKGDVTQSHVGWRVTNNVPANPSPVIVGQEIHMVSDQGIASCLDLQTGTEHYKTRLGASFSASPLAAPGRVYYFSEKGDVHVVQPGKVYQELAHNVMPDRIMASPAVAGGALFLRTETHLYRIERPAASAAKK
jgi:outer membrane protein assembly factor BamB